MRFAFLQEPPFCFTGDGGKVRGCDVELAETVCEKLGIKDFQPVEAEFAELLPGLNAERWTMTTGLFVSAERERIVNFTQPIWLLGDGLLVRKDNPREIVGYRSIATDPEAKLGVITDQIQHRTALENGVPPERIRFFSTQAEAAEAVANGTVHAYASVAMAHRGCLSRWPNMPLDVVDVSATEKEPAFGAFALAKSNGALRRRIDQCLGDLLGSSDQQGDDGGIRLFGFGDRPDSLGVRLRRRCSGRAILGALGNAATQQSSNRNVFVDVRPMNALATADKTANWHAVRTWRREGAETTRSGRTVRGRRPRRCAACRRTVLLRSQAA